MSDSSSSVRAVLSTLLALPLVGAIASAGVIVVDDDGGPGVDFTDLPPAVAAAVPGDVILVHPGGYSDFVLDKGVTILGTAPGVQVDTGTRITALPGGERAVLADMRLRDLRVLSSAGTVVLDTLQMDQSLSGAQPSYLQVDGSADVRMIRSSLLGPGSGGNTAAQVTGSRFELVESVVRGAAGTGTDCGSGGNGGLGLQVGGGSRVHLAQSDALGGAGGYVNYACPAFCNLGAGDGGDGLQLTAGSLLFVMGPSASRIQGGFAGDGGDCACDGYPGDGLVVSGSTAVYSGVTLAGGGAFCFGSGSALVVTGGGSATQAVPPDPYLQLQGTPGPGQQIRFTVWGEPGDQALVHLGRFAVVVPLPGVLIEQLTTEERTFNLGTISSSGNASLLFTVPAYLGTGFTFHAQGEVQRAGQELRTNSVPVVLR